MAPPWRPQEESFTRHTYITTVLRIITYSRLLLEYEQNKKNVFIKEKYITCRVYKQQNVAIFDSINGYDFYQSIHNALNRRRRKF